MFAKHHKTSFYFRIAFIRLLSNVESISFSSTLPVLGFLRDSVAQIVLNPSVIMRDPSLLNDSVVQMNMEHLGRNPNFIGTLIFYLLSSKYFFRIL